MLRYRLSDLLARQLGADIAGRKERRRRIMGYEV